MISARPFYYMGGNRALTQLSNGLPFFVNTEDRGITTWIVLGGVWETFVDNVLCSLCQPGMRICDLGANMGYYTIKLAHLAGPNGFVLSLEPNPVVFQFLEDNVNINGFRGRVQTVRAAASDEVGVLTLHFSNDNVGGASLHSGLSSGEVRRSEVRTLRVDDLMKDQPGFDLIKIDVEGWEPAALRGMRSVLERSPGAKIVTEVSWAAWRAHGDPNEILQLLGRGRDGVFIIHHDGHLQPVTLEEIAALGDRALFYVLFTPLDGQVRQTLSPFMTKPA
jgi:FkbM family methyltransferase